MRQSSTQRAARAFLGGLSRDGLKAKASRVLAMVLTSAVGARAVGLVAAMGGALIPLTDTLQLVLDLGQPAAQVRVLRLQVGDPLPEGGDEGQDSGLGLGWDRLPEGCRDRRWRSHALFYEASVQRVRASDGSGHPRIPSGERRTA